MPNITPIQAFSPQLIAAQGLAGSSSLTATLNLTAGWEVYVPFRGVQNANVTAGPEIRAYRSFDGGTTYETSPSAAFAIARNSGVDSTITLRLDTGQWALQIVSGGPNTATVAILTQVSITAISVI